MTENKLPIDTIGTVDEAIVVTAKIIENARRVLCIYSRDLDAPLYGTPSIIDAIRTFATRPHDKEVRILLQDAATPQRNGSALITLSQRLPTIIQFREITDPVDQKYTSAYIANDQSGFYFRQFGHRYDGNASLDHSGRARQLMEEFKPVWERSRPCNELRALGM